MSSLADLAKATKDFLNTQVMGTAFDVSAGEVENPSSTHGHVATGPGNSYVLLDDASNFQLFRSADPVLTFIYSNDVNASYWGGIGAQTIYDFGHANTLRFGELSGNVDVFGFDQDTTGKAVIYNAASTAITPDGRGGTMVGNIDFHNVVLDTSRVSFVQVNEPLANHVGLVPLT